MERTDVVVDCIVQSFCTGRDEKERFLLHQALTNLVRMAKAEKFAEVQRDLEFVNQVMVHAGSGY